MLVLTILLVNIGVSVCGVAPGNQDNVLKQEGPAYSDYNTPDFIYQNDMPIELNSTSCGGILVAEGGFVSYKYNEFYENNERCIWTIRTRKYQTSFLMHDSAFDSLNDHLSIYTLDENGNLEKKGTIDTGTGNRIVGIIAPIMFLVLTTDHTGVGKGFFLEYFEFGYNEATGYTYDHTHADALSGSVSWPEEPLQYPRSSLSTVTLSPPIQNGHLVLTVDKVDLLSLQSACRLNFFSVHQLYYGGFVSRLKYCQPDLQTLATISATSPLLITYKASVGPQHAGYSLNWRNRAT